MTVLRSREIVSTVSTNGSPRKALDNGATEPVTPPRTLEFANQSLISLTPSSSSSSSALNPTVELRSEAATVRRSARLSSKLGVGVQLENNEIVSGNRKKVNAKEIGGLEKRCLDSDLEAEKEGSFSKQRKSDCDGENLAVQTDSNDEGKVTNSMEDLTVLDSGNKDGKEVFLNLRSGKKVAKKTIDGQSGGGPSIGCIRVDSCDNDSNSGYVKESKILLNDNDVKSDRKRNMEEDIDNSWKKRRLGRAEQGKGKMVGKTLMIGSAVDINLEVDKESKILLNDNDVKSNPERNMEEDLNNSWKKRRLTRAEKGKVVARTLGIGSAVNMNLEVDKESKILLNDNDFMTDPERNMEEDRNNSWKNRRLTRAEKGKGKVVDKPLRMGSAVNMNLELDKEVGLLIDDSRSRLPESVDGVDNGAGVTTSARLRAEEKGKGKLVYEDSSSHGGVDALDQSFELRAENTNENTHAVNNHLPEDAALVDVNIVRERDAYKQRYRDIARQNASRFAHFSAEEEDQGLGAADIAGRDGSSSEEDWPGPFSTALKIVRDREKNMNGMYGSSVDKSKAIELTWVPRKEGQSDRQKQFLPSLQELCLCVLAKNADSITSLDFVPDLLRHKLCKLLCDSRKMTSHVLQLIVSGFPTEIRLRDCSWLSEELFTRIFENAETTNLMVLQLDQCGCCVPDYALAATLARSLNSLPALTTVSLKGAYRLSDAGLRALVSSAPSITSINLTECSLLTSGGICSLAKSLRSVLRELYIDDCLEIDAMLILPALLKLEHLEVLSLGGIQTVCDKFISEIVSVHGCMIKELGLARCLQLSDLSLKAIAATCVELQVIDLMNLSKLTDTAMAYLASGCQAIHTLKLCRNAFSDEAIAAYVEISGASLVELSLNNINKVSNNTAISIARHSKNLVTLDLSWCRNLTNEALGLIVDSCSSLEVLKLFGCTQVTNVFLDGHSNPQVKIVGMKMSQVFDGLKEPNFQ